MYHYIQVILPLKLDFEPFYKVSRKVSPGDRVMVRMSGREYTAVVSNADAVPDIPPEKILPATIPENPFPAITKEELSFWRFLSDYYLCTIGEVYAAAYPDLKTTGEAALAAARKRQEEKARKEAERKAGIIRRLEERLAKKDAQLDQNHGPAVRARILEEKKKIRLEINARLEADPADAGEPECPKPVTKTSNKTAKGLLYHFASLKPMLFQGGRQRETVIAECVRDILADGLNCLVIVPEIKMSENLIRQLRRKAGDRLTVFNSSESMGARRKAADDLRNDDTARVYVGTRSSLFLPFRRLGLVVVESEESTSHKSESSPRLNARDAAAMLARIHGCRLILSSSCPSLESAWNARTGKFTVMKLPDSPAETEIIDTGEEAKKRGMAGRLSIRLLNEIRRTVQKGGKTLILHPWTDDDVRNDLAAYARDLAEGNGVDITDIRDGKSRDISRYGLVAILQADRLGRRTDFRADERALQTITHVRTGFDGKLIIQAQGTGKHFLNLSDTTVDVLLSERREFSLPPFVRILDIQVTDSSENRLRYLTGRLFEELREFSPAPPAQRFIGNVPQEGFNYIRISIPKDGNGASIKNAVRDKVKSFERSMKYTGHIIIDVDPV